MMWLALGDLPIGSVGMYRPIKKMERMESKLQRNKSKSGSLARFKGFSKSIQQGYA